MDQLHATAFQYTPLGRTIPGPVSNLKAITNADIQEYISSNCAAHRMVISSKFHASDMFTLFNKLFSSSKGFNNGIGH